MNFTIHSKNSAKIHGGVASDYYKVHEFLDAAKDLLADSRHRLFLHNTLGVHLAVKAFGSVITNSEGREVSVAELARQHIIEDLMRIPTVEESVSHLDKSQYAALNSRVLGEVMKFKRKNEPTS